MKIPPISNILIDLDIRCDHLPLIASITNAVDLVFKIALRFSSPEPSRFDHYYEHIQEKSLWRSVTLLIPGVNFIFLYYDNRSEKAAIERVLKNGMALKELSYAEQNNKKIVIAAVTSNGLALQFASRRLKDDSDVVDTAVSQNGLALEFASPRHQKKKKTVFKAVQQNGLAILHSHLSSPLQQERALGYAIKQNTDVFDLEVNTLKNDPIFISSLLADSFPFSKVPFTLRNDSKVMLEASRLDPTNFDSTSEELRSNNSFLKSILTETQVPLEKLSQEKLNDHSFLISVAHLKSVKSYIFTNKSLDDLLTMKLFVNKKLNLEELTNEQRKKPDLILALSAKVDAKAITFADESLRNDPQYMQKVIETIFDKVEANSHTALNRLNCIKTALGNELKKNWDFIRSILRLSPFFIELLSVMDDELLNDEETMTQIIDKYPSAAQFIGQSLRGNLKFLYRASHSAPDVFKYASQSVTGNAYSMLTLIKNNVSLAKFIHDDLLENETFIEELKNLNFFEDAANPDRKDIFTSNDKLLLIALSINPHLWEEFQYHCTLSPSLMEQLIERDNDQAIQYIKMTLEYQEITKQSPQLSQGSLLFQNFQLPEKQLLTLAATKHACLNMHKKLEFEKLTLSLSQPSNPREKKQREKEINRINAAQMRINNVSNSLF